MLSSDDERHVLLVGQLGPLAEPEAVVDGEGVDGDRQVLRVDLGELLSARVVPEETKMSKRNEREEIQTGTKNIFGRIFVS